MKFSSIYSLCLLGAVALSSCSLGSLVDGAELASEVRDPAVVRTPEGATALFNGVNVSFARLVRGTTAMRATTPSLVRIVGIFTDELRADNLDVNFPGPNESGLDSRTQLGGVEEQLFRRIHSVRHLAQEARGLLIDLKIAGWEDRISQLYAIEGYLNIMLADLYCSSIPLSRIQYGGDYTLTEGFSTDEIYEQSLSLFDSADGYLTDLPDLQHFISIGKGRAFISLGQYQDAATATALVPDSYKYQLSYSANYPKDIPVPTYFIIADKEGINGMPFISENDPRTRTPEVINVLSPFTFAGGIEARLINIEAMIHDRDDRWIDELNSLRTTCTSPGTCLTPAPAGRGGVSGLSPMADSSLGLSDEAQFYKRIDMLFRERAYWLFLTGRRQGDLRRLIRRYGRQPYTVYPTGAWGTRGFTAYGTAVSLPVPEREAERNPLYTRCVSQDA